MAVAGMLFRDAYKAVAEQLKNRILKSQKETKQMHKGSINKICLEEIKKKMNDSY
ncbi:hypothetical protein [Flavobacterium xueshanense]|nr:hypothetical protein [Flavobacterium xueshanense]